MLDAAPAPESGTLPRWWAGPLVSGVLLLLLVGIAALLPYHQLRGGYSTAGAWLHRHFFPAEQNISAASSIAMYVTRDGSGLRVINADQSEGDALTLLAEHPDTTIHMQYRPQVIRLGWWAITHEVQNHAIQIDGGSALTPAEKAEARRIFVERAAPWFPKIPDAVFSALRRGETINTATVRYEGYVGNMLTLLLTVAFVLSLRWSFSVPARFRSWRRARALAAGRCPACGYSLSGLATRVCPECGRGFPARAGS